MRKNILRFFVIFFMVLAILMSVFVWYYKQKHDLLNYEFITTEVMAENIIRQNDDLKQQLALMDSELKGLQSYIYNMSNINMTQSEDGSEGSKDSKNIYDLIPQEKPSPQDFVKERDIYAYNNKIVFYISDPFISKFSDTNSMDPTFDIKANGIEVKPKSTADISVGDVISYNTDEGIIVHRVVEINRDDEGWYAIAQGDNEVLHNFAKIRFEQIKGVVVAVIY